MDVSPLSQLATYLTGMRDAANTSRPVILEAIKRVFAFSAPNADNSNPPPLSFYKRVSNDIDQHPVMWSLIAYQISMVVHSLVFKAVVTTLANLVVLGAFFYMRYLIQENETLGTMKDQLSKMKQNNKDMEEELKRLKSATSDLIETILKIDKATDSLSSTVITGNSSLTAQIQQLNGAADIFIKLIQQKHEDWSHFTKKLHEHEIKIQEATARAEERENFAKQTDLNLQALQVALQTEMRHLNETKQALKDETLKLTAIRESLILVLDKLQNVANQQKAWSQPELKEVVQNILQAIPNIGSRNNHLLGSQEITQ